MINQKGEVVTGVMIAIMVGMMVFGMFFMHGGHGHTHDHGNTGQKQEHAGMGHQHMHQNGAEKVSDPSPAVNK